MLYQIPSKKIRGYDGNTVKITGLNIFFFTGDSKSVQNVHYIVFLILLLLVLQKIKVATLSTIGGKS